ncbi:MAG TPA: ADOP family duplicated permease [Longimicrobiales bacterium]|nr:ADOP family duplicated permease [Longimicrobiales bacterium]
MSLLSRARSLLRGLRGSPDRGHARLDSDLEDEFSAHIALRTDHLIQSGLSPVAAARRARLEFGSADRFREESRQARGLRLYDELRSDLHFAARSLARRPMFTVIAVLTLALGVGSNAAVFSLVNATLLRPLPFEDPDRLVVLQQAIAEDDRAPRALRWSYPEYDALQAAVGAFSDIASYAAATVNLRVEGGALRTSIEHVSAGYLETLRVVPIRGRTFLPEEDAVPGARPVAILAHAEWQQHFGSDAAVIGRTVRVNGVPLEVVGVAPPGFRGMTGEAALWIPQAMAPTVSYAGQLTSSQHFHSVIARLAGGVTIEQARAEVAVAGANAAAAARGAEAGAWSADVVPLDAARRSPEAVRARVVLAGAVSLVLLIAAVNLTALFLARAVERSRELALRTALGAGRRRLIRQIMTEGAAIGTLGAVLGVALAAQLIRTLAAVAADRLAGPGPWFADMTSFDAPTLDWRVAAFTAVIAMGAGLAAALLPALRATRGALSATLKIGARGSTMGVGTLRRPTALSVAAVAQVASALVLVVGAALLLRELERLRAVDPGYTAEELITLSVAGDHVDMDFATAHAIGAPMLERMLERVQAVPGVTAATLSFCTPYMGCSSTPLYLDATSPPDAPVVGRHYVAPDHFRTFGIPLLRGRGLTADDREGRPRVAVINETAARTFWPGEDPIGKRVRFGSGGGFASPDSLTEIVGVVGDVVYGNPRDPIEPDFYTSYLQFTWPRAIVTARAAGDPLTLVPALRSAVAADGSLAVHDVRSMQQRSDDVLSNERFAVLSMTAFAALGLLLALAGVYGVMAYSVAQRRREMGIRLALGATRGGILRFVVVQGVAVAAAGVLIGALATAGVTRALGALIPGAGAPAPLVTGAIALLLMLVCAAACVLPARSAARVDPVQTLAAD